jgi:hypothetical protein
MMNDLTEFYAYANGIARTYAGEMPRITATRGVDYQPSATPQGGDGVPPEENSFRDMIANAIYGRREIEKLLADPRRDVDKECGYPVTAEISKGLYWKLFERDGLAARVVEVLPKESWQVTPLVYAKANPSEQEQFDIDWAALPKLLRGMRSWHKQETGSLVWSKLIEGDVLSGVGHCGIVLFGFSDVGTKHPITGKVITLQDPVDMVLANCDIRPDDFYSGPELGNPELSADDVDPELTVPSTPTDDGEQFNPTSSYAGMDTALAYRDSLGGERPKMRLMFLRAFPENLFQTVKWDSNPKSPRFNQPVEYLVTFIDTNNPTSGVGRTQTSKYVHWTRVLHLADTGHQASTSPTEAAPRIRPVLNEILDAIKTRGGTAEGHWRSAFPGLSFETIPQLGGNVRINTQELRDMYESYVNGQDRALFTRAMQVKTLSPNVVDCTPQVNLHIDVICIKIGCPKRIFMGSERGELASTQDDDAWNDRLKARQDTYITPHIVVPFVDRLIMAGVLAEPEDGYTVEWPDLTSKSDSEKAAVGLQLTQALIAFISGNGEGSMTFTSWLIDFMGFPEDRAKAIQEEWERMNAGLDTGIPEDDEVTSGGDTPPTPGDTSPQKDDGGYEDMFSEVSADGVPVP